MHAPRLLRRLASAVARFGPNDRAATAVEYGLIVAIIALGMLAGFMPLATVTLRLWNSVAAAFPGA